MRDLSVKIRLQDRLQNLIGLSSFGNCLGQTIPVEQWLVGNGVEYRSAIALKLAAHSSQTPLAIAEHLLQNLLPSPEFTLSINPPGWIHWRMSEPAIGQWLQQLHQTPLTLPTPQHTPLNPHQPEIFLWQATHARCCALWRLGNQSLDPTTATFQWLTPDQKLLLEHPTEYRLIERLFSIVDTLSDPNRQRIPQLIALLSEDFLEFDRHCRIIHSPTLLGRLGLIRLVQQTLNTLLEQGLGVFAPPEL